MDKTNVTKRVTATILSMSLLTVMAGAAIAPALGIIKAHFSEADALLVQLIVSMPALLIIVTNLFFLSISRRLRSRAIATTGLLLYVVAGAGCLADEKKGWALVKVVDDRRSPQTIVTRCTLYQQYTTEDALERAADSYGGLTETPFLSPR